jgi:hypothetical protein
VFAHAALQMRETIQVLDTAVGSLVAHARIPTVKALDDADQAAARKTSASAICVSGVIGQEMGMAVIFVSCASDVWGGVELQMIFALGDGQGGVDSWCVKVPD